MNDCEDLFEFKHDFSNQGIATFSATSETVTVSLQTKAETTFSVWMTWAPTSLELPSTRQDFKINVFDCADDLKPQIVPTEYVLGTNAAADIMVAKKNPDHYQAVIEQEKDIILQMWTGQGEPVAQSAENENLCGIWTYRVLKYDGEQNYGELLEGN